MILLLLEHRTSAVLVLVRAQTSLRSCAQTIRTESDERYVLFNRE